MTRLIDIPKIATALTLTGILAAGTWFVNVQIMNNRLQTVEKSTRSIVEIHTAVNNLIVEIKHTNSAVIKNAERTDQAYAKIATTREESLVGFLALESIATVQKSLVASVATLSTSVTELSTILKYRNGMASIDIQSTDPYPN